MYSSVERVCAVIKASSFYFNAVAICPTALALIEGDVPSFSQCRRHECNTMCGVPSVDLAFTY